MCKKEHGLPEGTTPLHDGASGRSPARGGTRGGPCISVLQSPILWFCFNLRVRWHGITDVKSAALIQHSGIWIADIMHKAPRNHSSEGKSSIHIVIAPLDTPPEPPESRCGAVCFSIVAGQQSVYSSKEGTTILKRGVSQKCDVICARSESPCKSGSFPSHIL
jgi:hypothetical protein